MENKNIELLKIDLKYKNKEIKLLNNYIKKLEDILKDLKNGK